MCDIVYVLHLDRIERHVLAERQVAIVALAGGAKDVEMPTLDGAIDLYEQALIEPPRLVDRDHAELLAALGVS